MKFKSSVATLLVLSLCAACAVLAAAIRGAPQISQPKAVDLSGLTVIGIQARTSYARESGPQGVIGPQWTKFMTEGWLNKIPNRADRNMMAVYTDYENEYKGQYTFVVGAKVKADTAVPSGMIAVKVPAGHYAMFTTDTGPVQQILPTAWRAIWALPKSSLGGDRTYKTDFEVYDQRAMNPQNSQVDIYIGIK